MMIKLTEFSFKYPGQEFQVLDRINLEIPESIFCLLVGPSGVGKSTLLKSINGLVPHFTGGNASGFIEVCGHDPIKASPTKMSEIVGFVFQDPEKQFVFDRVEDELRFNLENSGVGQDEIDSQITSIFDLLDIHELRKRQVHTLSGGEKQIVCIAAALVKTPQILILDEPTSQLDPQNAEQILQTLQNLKERTSLTIIVSEHRIERVLPFTDSVILMQENSPRLAYGPPDEVLQLLDDPPASIKAFLHPARTPANLDYLSDAQNKKFTDHEELEPSLSVINLHVSIGNKEILNDVSINLYPGEIHCMMGQNGSGKTTLLRSIMALQKTANGTIILDHQDVDGWSTYNRAKKVAYLPQDPNALLFAETLTQELQITLENHRESRSEYELRISRMLQDLGLGQKAKAYPRDLSVGERQRAALGTVTIIDQPIIILDEPTRGLDYAAKRKIQELLEMWKNKGSSIFLVTHDVEWVYHFADRVSILEAGQVVDSGPTRGVLMRNEIFRPQVYELFRSA